jgi:hypothetical protein
MNPQQLNATGATKSRQRMECARLLALFGSVLLIESGGRLDVQQTGIQQRQQGLSRRAAHSIRLAKFDRLSKPPHCWFFVLVFRC